MIAENIVNTYALARIECSNSAKFSGRISSSIYSFCNSILVSCFGVIRELVGGGEEEQNERVKQNWAGGKNINRGVSRSWRRKE